MHLNSFGLELGSSRYDEVPVGLFLLQLQHLVLLQHQQTVELLRHLFPEVVRGREVAEGEALGGGEARPHHGEQLRGAAVQHALLELLVRLAGLALVLVRILNTGWKVVVMLRAVVAVVSQVRHL